MTPPDIDARTALLGGLTPRAFMRSHWQRRPLLVRGAWPEVRPPLERAALFRLAESEHASARLVVRDGRSYEVRTGSIGRRALPPIAQRRWTLLVPGVDRHVDAAAGMLARFRFVGDARLDDLMVSWASDGGGVGPHVDSYDVFLLQVQGRRRWRIGRVDDPTLIDGLPLRVLKRFVAEEEWLLEPGDMLYLPPQWGHDGVAVGECMTCSIGFRAPQDDVLASALLERLADMPGKRAPVRYRDRAEGATSQPARIPESLAAFAQRALARAASDPNALGMALGEWLSEPAHDAVFAASGSAAGGVRADRATRLLYDRVHLFVNGEAFVVGGRDAALLRRLADRRRLEARHVGQLGADARAALDDWIAAGWFHCEED